MRSVFFLFILSAVLLGCNNTQPPGTVSHVNGETQVVLQSEIVNHEVIQGFEIDNCDGRVDATRTEQRSSSIDVTISTELAATIGASAQVLSADVQAAVGTALSIGGERVISIELTAPPNTHMFFQVVWVGKSRIGVVQNVRGSSIPVAFQSFTPDSVRIKSLYNLGCADLNPTTAAAILQPTMIIAAPTSVTTPLGTSIPFSPTAHSLPPTISRRATATPQASMTIATPTLVTTPGVSTPFSPTAHSLPPTIEAKIETEWPEKLELHRSSSIRVSLKYGSGINLVPTIEVRDNLGMVVTVIPVGTPGPLAKAQGADYIAFIDARLVGSAFDITKLNPEPYTLHDQETTTWDWSITPRQPGKRELLLVIEIAWISNAREEKILYQLGRQRLEVFVKEPLVTRGQPFTITSIITAFFGGLVTLTAKDLWPLVVTKFFVKPKKSDLDLQLQIDEYLKTADFEAAMSSIAQVENNSLRTLLWRKANTAKKETTKNRQTFE